MDPLLEAAAILQPQPIALVLVGQGPEKAALQERATQRGLANVVFLPPVPKAAIPALLAGMDALYLGWAKKPIYRFGISPNKLMDYMLAGKPIVHAVEASNDLVSQSGCGVSCPPEDPPALAQAVLELLRRTPAEREALGQAGKDYVLAHHQYSTLARRFLEVLETKPSHSHA